MTNEKLNELKEVVEKAGKCKIVTVTVNGTCINFFTVMDDIVMYEAEGHFCRMKVAWGSTPHCPSN